MSDYEDNLLDDIFFKVAEKGKGEQNKKSENELNNYKKKEYQNSLTDK